MTQTNRILVSLAILAVLLIVGIPILGWLGVVVAVALALAAVRLMPTLNGR